MSVHHLLASPSRGRGPSSLTSSYEKDEPSHHGYLNRKSEGAMGRKTKVLHRDKGWQLLWCNLKANQLEFYKVEGVRIKPGEAPPRDIYPPANLMKTKVDSLDMEGALVEIDYVSQENKDIQKRRRYLFRVEHNNMEYILQAPTSNQRNLWVSALQRASGQLSGTQNTGMTPGLVSGGHAIKAVRDSIKHNRRQVQRTRSPGYAGVGQSISDDNEYVEFSKAEEMVRDGGDPRLQALRKRLQAKKELLKQLDRMYSSYMGGSAAAMYDDSLILQQLEPPVFSNGSASVGQVPEASMIRKRSKSKSAKVVHRKLPVSEASSVPSRQYKSMDRGIDDMGGEGQDTPSESSKEGRRASTGEIHVPTEVARVESQPQITEDVLESELLTDYYLVPGAPWSLLRKGEKVQVLGKAQETGWYRCMAMRHAEIKLDHSAFAVLTMTTGPDHRKTRSYDEKGTWSDDSSMDASSLGGSYDFHQHHDISISISSTSSSAIQSSPISMSCPSASLMGERAEIFQMDLAGDGYGEAARIDEEDEEEEREEEEAVAFGERDIGSKEEILPADMAMDDPDSFVMVNYPSSSVDQNRESTMSSDFGSIPSFSSVGTGDAQGASSEHHEGESLSAMSGGQSQGSVGLKLNSSSPEHTLITDNLNEVEKETADKNVTGQSLAEGEEPSDGGCLGGADGEVVLRSNSRGKSVERPLSYKLATDEEQSLENLLSDAGLKPQDEDAKRENRESSVDSVGSKSGRKSSEKSSKNKRNSGANIKRSTSTVTQSSQAAITLRRSLGTSRAAKAQSSRVSASGYSLPTSFSSAMAARNAFFMWSKLDDLMKKELRTGTYPAPLIGCIPPSALKVFADEKKNKDGDDALPSSPSGHSNSENSDSNSRPVSGRADSPEQNDRPTSKQQPSTAGGEEKMETDKSSSSQSDAQIKVVELAVTKDSPVLDAEKKTRTSSRTTLERSNSLTRSQESRGSGSPYPRLSRAGTLCSDDDSDGEADRRMAQLFKTNQVISPDDDIDLLNIRYKASHTRTKSLPPPMIIDIDRDDESPPPPLPPRMEFDDENGTNGEDREEEAAGKGGTGVGVDIKVEMESSLDRSPSHMRKFLKGSSTDTALQYQAYSVGSSPVHRPTTPEARRPSSPFPFQRKSSKIEHHSGSLESSSPSKPGLFKKLFNRSKNKLPQATPTQGTTKLGPPQEPTSSGRLSPGLLKHVLLGNQDEIEDSSPRLRMSSISGRPVRQEGMAILIGEDSSSESDGEGEESNRYSNASSLQDEATVPEHAQNGSTKGDSTPASPVGAAPSLQDKKRKTRGQSDSDIWRPAQRETGRSGLPGEDAIQESPFIPGARLKRSASDHDSLALKASDKAASPTDPYGKPGTTSSLKRNLSSSSIVKLMIKKGSKTVSSPSASPVHQTAAAGAAPKKGRQSKKKKKKRPPSAYEIDSEENGLPLQLDQQESSIKMTGIIRQPPHGEKRYVYLDPNDGRFGFRLQSYGRIREQGQVLQTFVQSVAPGTPAFMAGLYPGDAIVEVNGIDVKYAPVESVVAAIKKGSDKGERILLKVEFVDGVTRLDCMKKADDFKNEIKVRQARLKELLEEEKSHPPLSFSIPSPSHITPATALPVWADTTLSGTEDNQQTFLYNKQLNQVVCVHCGLITSLECSVLVMPISSCFKPKNPGDKNFLLQLLRSGGPGLLDDLSLAKQCKIGDNISTWGHDLPAKYIYHCVFGDLEESLQSCCHKALETASEQNLSTVVFWLDGFASLQVSPHLVIEAVRCWMQQDMSRNTFKRVVFSSSANCTLVENIMSSTFPLHPPDSISLTSDPAKAAEVVHNGVHNGVHDEEDDLDDVMAKMEGLIHSLETEQATLDSRKVQSQEIREGDSPSKNSKEIFRCKSLPISSLLEDFANMPEEWGRRSMSPLNPDRVESEV